MVKFTNNKAIMFKNTIVVDQKNLACLKIRKWEKEGKEFHYQKERALKGFATWVCLLAFTGNDNIMGSVISYISYIYFHIF